MNHYIHDVPGRLRIKTPKIKGNQEAEYQLKKLLCTMPGIATVEINLLTGSLLINYNPKSTTKNSIIRVLSQKGYFDPSKAFTNDQYIQDIAAKTGKLVGRTLVGAAFDGVLAGTPLSFLTMLI